MGAGRGEPGTGKALGALGKMRTGGGVRAGGVGEGEENDEGKIGGRGGFISFPLRS